MAITIRLLQLELAKSDADTEDARILSSALQKFDFNYLDANTTQIDSILDSANVARLSSVDVLGAIETVIFDVK